MKTINIDGVEYVKKSDIQNIEIPDGDKSNPFMVVGRDYFIRTERIISREGWCGLGIKKSPWKMLLGLPILGDLTNSWLEKPSTKWNHSRKELSSLDAELLLICPNATGGCV